MTISTAVALGGFVIVGVLTAAAAAVRTVSRIWLRHWVEQQIAGRFGVPRSLDDIRRLLLAAGTSVALVAFATGVLIGIRPETTVFATVERIVVASLVFLLVGQLLPRAIGRRWATRLVPVLVPVLRGLGAVLAPLLLVAQELARLGRRVDVAPAASDDREALEELLRDGELEGVGDANESAIITGIVDFSVKRARDVMTPRGDIFAIEDAMPFREAARQIAEAKYSRVPLMRGGLDRIVGMWHAFDVLKGDLETPPPLREVMRAPEAMPATELLARMLRERIHLSIIVDAAAHTAGLVTLEDLLEELVGEIRDEHDEPVVR